MTSVQRVRAYWRGAEDLRQRAEKGRGLFWIRRVNRRIGALVAYALLPTTISPNWVSLAGLAVHSAGALLVATADTPIGIGHLLGALVLFQVGFSLDCADGQLARARGQTSAFGAWLDVVLDFVSHGVVITVLVAYVVEVLAIESEIAAGLAGGLVALSILQLFASSLRNAVMGTERAITPRRRSVAIMEFGRQLNDYGAFLFIAAVLLAWPIAELAFLIVTGLFNGAAVAGQVAVNWYASSLSHADGNRPRVDTGRT